MKTSPMKNSTYQPLFYSKMKHSLLDLKKKEENFSVLDQCMGKKRYSRHFWFSFILYLQQQTKHVIQSYFDIYFQEREMWEIPVSYSSK